VPEVPSRENRKTGNFYPLKQNQFQEDGCENCPFFKESEWELGDCTTPNYEGMIAVMNPEESWVSKWLDLDSFMPGCYCLKIFGELPEDVITYFKERKIKYVRNNL
jgi:transcription elongation factor SPT4